MINQINEQIKLWLKDIVSDIEIRFCSPGDYVDTNQINIYLSSLEPVMGNSNPSFMQIKLKYLITICCASDEQVHSIAYKFLESGSNHPLFTMVPDRLSDDYWRALKVKPQPLFSITYILEIPRRQSDAPFVKELPNIVTTAMSHIYGKVLDANNKPVSRCRLELQSQNRSVLTDYQGRFDLGQVSSASSSIINIYTRSDKRSYTYVFDKFDGKEVTISLEKLEKNNA